MAHFNHFNYIPQSIPGIVGIALGLLIIYEKDVAEELFS